MKPPNARGRRVTLKFPKIRCPTCHGPVKWLKVEEKYFCERCEGRKGALDGS